MKLLTAILLLKAILGCGRDTSGEQAATQKTTLQSISLKTFDDLPDCTEMNVTQLAYLLDEEKFYVCENDTWTPIEVKGEQGDEGTVGSTGKSGAKGEKGEPGANGEDGQEGQTVTTNNWLDQTSGKLWLIGAIGTYAQLQTSCITPWRAPTYSEAMDATLRGLGIAAATISGPTTIWTSTPYVLNTARYSIVMDIHTAPTESNAHPATESKGIFCIGETP